MCIGRQLVRRDRVLVTQTDHCALPLRPRTEQSLAQPNMLFFVSFFALFALSCSSHHTTHIHKYTHTTHITHKHTRHTHLLIGNIYGSIVVSARFGSYSRDLNEFTEL